MGIIIFCIFIIIDILAIFVTGALASAVPVIEYNYYALYQNICIGILFLSMILLYLWISFKK